MDSAEMNLDKEVLIVKKLTHLLKDNGEEVLNGTGKLSLTTTCVKVLNHGIKAVRDEDLTSSFEVVQGVSPRLPSYIHNMQFLYDFVQKTPMLKVTHLHSITQSTLDLSPFHSLISLELKRQPITLVKGLQRMRSKLNIISCVRCLDSLQELFESCGSDESSAMTWQHLHTAKLAYNNIHSLDTSLRLLPGLEYLDLSHNNIRHIENYLEYLSELKVANLGYNNLLRVPVFSLTCRSRITTLILRNNSLEIIHGLEELTGLKELDISHNLICDHSCLEPVRRLARLCYLQLEGNPLYYHSNHRQLTVARLHPLAVRQFILDKKKLQPKEQQLVSNTVPTSYKRHSSQNLLLEHEGGYSSLEHSYNEHLLSTDQGATSSQSHTDAVILPVRSKKKVRKARKAQISDMDSSGVEDASPGSSKDIPQESPAGSYLKQELESLRKELGPDWLQSLTTKKRTAHHNPENPKSKNRIEENDDDIYLRSTNPTDGAVNADKTTVKPDANASVVDSQEHIKLSDSIPQHIDAYIQMKSKEQILQSDANTLKSNTCLNTDEVVNDKNVGLKVEQETKQDVNLTSEVQRNGVENAIKTQDKHIRSEGSNAENTDKTQVSVVPCANVNNGASRSSAQINDASKKVTCVQSQTSIPSRKSSSSESGAIYPSNTSRYSRQTSSASSTAVYSKQDSDITVIDYGDESEPFIITLTSEPDNPLLVTVCDRYILEKDFNGIVIEKLDLRSLLSATLRQTEETEDGPMLYLTFDYVKKDRRERLYVMEDIESAENFLSLLEPTMEKKQKETLSKDRLQCLKCGHEFRKGTADRYVKHVVGSFNTKSGDLEECYSCPQCTSDMVIEIDCEQNTPPQTHVETPTGTPVTPLATSSTVTTPYKDSTTEDSTRSAYQSLPLERSTVYESVTDHTMNGSSLEYKSPYHTSPQNTVMEPNTALKKNLFHSPNTQMNDRIEKLSSSGSSIERVYKDSDSSGTSDFNDSRHHRNTSEIDKSDRNRPDQGKHSPPLAQNSSLHDRIGIKTGAADSVRESGSDLLILDNPSKHVCSVLRQESDIEVLPNPSTTQSTPNPPHTPANITSSHSNSKHVKYKAMSNTEITNNNYSGSRSGSQSRNESSSGDIIIIPDPQVTTIPVHHEVDSTNPFYASSDNPFDEKDESNPFENEESTNPFDSMDPCDSTNPFDSDVDSDIAHVNDAQNIKGAIDKDLLCVDKAEGDPDVSSPCGSLTDKTIHSMVNHIYKNSISNDLDTIDNKIPLSPTIVKSSPVSVFKPQNGVTFHIGSIDSTCTSVSPSNEHLVLDRNPSFEPIKEEIKKFQTGEKSIQEEKNQIEISKEKDEDIVSGMTKHDTEENSIYEHYNKSGTSPNQEPLTGSALMPEMSAVDALEQVEGSGLKYSFKDFSQVDHRLKLHLLVNVFEEDNEELRLLLRCGIVGHVINKEYLGILVVSNVYVYVMKITGAERGDGIDKWLHVVDKQHLKTVKYIDIYLGYQAFRMETSCVAYTLLVREERRCQSFLAQFTAVIKDLSLTTSTELEGISKNNPQTIQDLTKALTSNHEQHDDIDTSVQKFVMCTLRTSKSSKDGIATSVVLTQTHICLLDEDHTLPLPRWTTQQQENKSQFTLKDIHKIVDITSVDIYPDFPLELCVHFTDETSGEESKWPISLQSEEALLSLVNSIKNPWEEEFGVELSMGFKMTLE